MLKKLLGRCLFKIKGLNVERLMNECLKQKIKLNLLDRNKDKIIFECEYACLKQVKNLIKNYELLEIRYNGIIGIIKLFQNKIPLLVTLAVCVFVLVFWQTHLWNYSISGLNRVEQSSVVQFLKDNQCGLGTNLKKLNSEKIANALYENFSELSFVSVMNVGTSLVLNFQEKEYDENLDESKMLPVIANFDGVVSSIEVSQGTPLVKVGDIVKAGQTLIAPYVVVDGVSHKVRAKGSVWASVFIKGQVVFKENGVKKIRSGKVQTIREMELLGQKFDLKSEKLQFAEYEAVKSSKIYCNNMPLCFKIVETKYYELVDVKETKKFEDEKELLKKQSRYLAYKNLKADFNVTSEQTDIVNSGENYYITTYLKVVTEIGVY